MRSVELGVCPVPASKPDIIWTSLLLPCHCAFKIVVLLLLLLNLRLLITTHFNLSPVYI